MAGQNTVSITFKLDGDNKGFKALATDANGLKSVMTGAIVEADKLKKGLINFAALATGINAAQQSVNQLMSGMKSLADAYGIQESAETKLQTVMQQRMGATAAEIQSIKDLASAQQQLGIIGDEVQLAGAQQVATFLNQKSSIDTLLPAMNNLLAQQKGYEASASDAVSIGNLLGKAMQGQVSALSRVGITFSEAESKVLKYGTETEKAAILAEVITNNVGDMNAELAKTDSGQQKQLENALGDVQEKLGGLVNGALPFVTISAHALTAAGSAVTLTTGIVSFTKATIAAISKEKIAEAASNAWTAAQKALNFVLSMNPIGVVVLAIGALVGALVYAYNHSESFRDICNQLWGAIKPLASAIMDGLVKALTWVVDKAKQAWDWLKRILGLGGQKVEVDVDVNTNATNTEDLKLKYANYTPPKTSAPTTMSSPQMSSPKAPEESDNTPIWKEDAATLKDITSNIDILNEKLQTASVEEAALINQQISGWQAKADAITNAGAAVETNTVAWNATASTIKDIEGNIGILSQKLQTASMDEAAAINREIKLWQQKSDAIKQAGLDAESTGVKTEDSLMGSWGGIKQLGSSIEGITSALQGNGNAWQTIVSIVDGFIGLYNGIQTILEITHLLTAASAAHAVTKGAEAVAETTAATARSAAVAANATTTAATVVVNKLAAASFKELAAAEYMAAHAYIPFAGFGIAMGFTTAMMAAVTTAGIPMLANGGIATGPTLAMVGEYGGASNNPEIIAPLDKLRSLINTDGAGVGGAVSFEIDGYKLRGVLNKINDRSSRG